MRNLVVLILIGCVLGGIAAEKPNRHGLTDADGREILELIHSNHLAVASLAYRAAVAPRMLAEVNWFSDKLQLPTPHPIQPSDIKNIHIIAPWYSGFDQGLLNTNIASTAARLLAAKVTVRGVMETTNLFFSFKKGKLWNVCRMENGRNYIDDEKLAKWQNMPSLINESQACQLAAQWLAAADTDMAALAKLKPTVHQLRYLPRGSTNAIMMPFYYVDFGTKRFHAENIDSDEPLIEVKILGVTKELMELNIADETLSRRAEMVITNAIELSRIPNPPMMQLQRNSMSQTNSPASP